MPLPASHRGSSIEIVATASVPLLFAWNTRLYSPVGPVIDRAENRAVPVLSVVAVLLRSVAFEEAIRAETTTPRRGTGETDGVDSAGRIVAADLIAKATEE